MKIEFNDSSTLEITDYDPLSFRCNVKMEDIVSVIERLSINNLRKIKILDEFDRTIIFKNWKLLSFVCVQVSDDILDIVFQFESIPEDTIALAEEREEREALANIIEIGLNYADPEEVVKWCKLLSDWNGNKWPYQKGERFKYNNKPYECLDNFVSDQSKTPFA